MANLLLLRRLPLFSSVSLPELRQIQEQMEIVPFSEGEVICEEGKPGGEALYIIASGQVKVVIGEKTLTILSHGNYFGEVSLLSGEPHSATIQATKAGMLLVTKKDHFDAIVKKYPKVLLRLSQALGKKVRQTAQFTYHEKEEIQIIAVFSTERKCGKSLLAANLSASLKQQTGKKVLLLDFYFSPGSSAAALKICPPYSISDAIKTEGAFNLSDFERSVVGHPCGVDLLVFYREGDTINFEKEGLAKILDLLKEKYQIIVLDIPSGINIDLVKYALSNADEALFLEKENSAGISNQSDLLEELKRIYPQLETRLWAGIFSRKTKKENKKLNRFQFIFPYDDLAGDSSIDGTPFVIAHSDALLTRVINRLARWVANFRIGLALSAGMAPALAHIGVFKVLQRENIPVDIVAGTSGGALYASTYVANISVTEVEKAARKMGKLKLLSMLDFTFPYAGFIRGKNIVDFVRSFIGEVKFEDLPIPFKVITTDFNSGEIFIFDKGTILDALRASMSVPGIFVPYRYENRFLVDGATVSPLPVDTLLHAGAEKVIAVNTCTDPSECYRNKCHVNQLPKLPPHFFDVITHSRAITSYHIAAMESAKADVVISPRTSCFKWRDYHEAAKIIEAGEVAAEEALPRIRSLISPVG